MNELYKKFLSGLNKVNKTRMDEYASFMLEEIDTDNAYLELKNKFDTEYEKDEIFSRFSEIDYKVLDIYLNYLLSLNKEEYKKIVWNCICSNDEYSNRYSGKVKELYIEKNKSYKDYYKRIENSVILNNTMEYSNDLIKLRRLETSDVEYLLNTIFDTYVNSDIDGNLWYGIQDFNHQSEANFVILDKSNNICGVIGLNKINHQIMECNYTYNLGIHLLPGFRNKGIGSSAIRLLSSLAFNDLIIVDQECNYRYKYERKPLKIEFIYAYIDSRNIASIKAIEKANYKLIGNFKTFNDDKKQVEWCCYMTGRSTYGK